MPDLVISTVRSHSLHEEATHSLLISVTWNGFPLLTHENALPAPRTEMWLLGYLDEDMES